MSIQITQTCDGCQRTRPMETALDERKGGWREVGKGRHLCGQCLLKALTPSQLPGRGKWADG